MPATVQQAAQLAAAEQQTTLMEAKAKAETEMNVMKRLALQVNPVRIDQAFLAPWRRLR